MLVVSAGEGSVCAAVVARLLFGLAVTASHQVVLVVVDIEMRRRGACRAWMRVR